MIGTLVWNTEILRTRGEKHRPSQSRPAPHGSALLSSTHAPIPHLTKLLSFHQGLSPPKLGSNLTQRLRASTGQSRDIHTKAVPSSPWQAEFPFVFDLHKSWKEHREFPGILHPPSANATILHNQAHLAKREINAGVTPSPQLQAACSRLLPRLGSNSVSTWYLVISSYSILSPSPCLMTLAILLLSPCPLSRSRISYRPIRSQTFNVATVDLEILILLTQCLECWTHRQKSLMPSL